MNDNFEDFVAEMDAKVMGLKMPKQPNLERIINSKEIRMRESEAVKAQPESKKRRRCNFPHSTGGA